jgi:hypothetical protein
VFCPRCGVPVGIPVTVSDVHVSREHIQASLGIAVVEHKCVIK